MSNKEPLTWACECGQMNLMKDGECFACGGDKDDCWAEDDRKRVVFVDRSRPTDMNLRFVIIGMEDR